jgi:hypothetical protein
MLKKTFRSSLAYARGSVTASESNFVLPSRDRKGASRSLFQHPVKARFSKPAIIAAIMCLPAIGITLLQNKQITGSWTTLPYALSQYEYGVPASFTFRPHPVPHHQLTREQELDYRMQRAFRAREIDTAGSYFQRLVYRVRYYRFYLYPALYIAVIAFLVMLRDYRSIWIVSTLVLFALGTNFYPIFLTHYIAAVSCLFILMSVEGLRKLPPSAARALIYICVAQFVFSYGVQIFASDRNAERRIEVNGQLAAIPGKLLVFVRYWPQHIFQEEWVYNAADIDRARIVWARDLGDAEDEKLRGYYPDRTVLVLEPDARPPRLTLWKPEGPRAPEPKPKQEKEVPKIPFEPVH